MFGQLILGGNPQFSGSIPPVPMSTGSNADYVFDAELITAYAVGDAVRVWEDINGSGLKFRSGTVEAPILRKDSTGRKYLEFTGTKRMNSSDASFTLPAAAFGITMVTNRDSFLGAGGALTALMMTFNGTRHYYRESTQVRLNDGTIKGGHGGELNNGQLDIITMSDRNGITMVQNGVCLQNAAQLAGADITSISLGRRENDTIGFIGKIYYIELYTAPVGNTLALIQENDQRIRDIIGWQYKVPKIIWQGNSLIEGYKQTQKSARPVEKGYQLVSVAESKPPKTDYVVRGYAGATTDVLGVGTLYDYWIYPHLANIDESDHPVGTGLGQWLVIWELSNTMFSQGKSDTDTYADLIAYTGQMKTAFPDLKIAVVTCIPRKDASMDPKRLSVNAMVKGGGTLATGRTYVFERNEDSIDVIIDPCLLPHFLIEDNADNTTYYNADKIHLNDTGAAEIGIAFADFINYVYDL